MGDTELAKLNSEQATIFRCKQIGFIFQNYNLVLVLSVWENIIFPISLDGRKPDKKFITGIVKLLGLEKKLARRPGQVFTARQIYEAVAADSFDASWTGISSMIYKLRRKLGSDIIKTVRGHGYRMRITK